MDTEVTDTQILDWLERNLVRISKDQHPTMDGLKIRGQLDNEARGAGAGPSYVNIKHITIREAVISAMNWKNS